MRRFPNCPRPSSHLPRASPRANVHQARTPANSLRSQWFQMELTECAAQNVSDNFFNNVAKPQKPRLAYRRCAERQGLRYPHEMRSAFVRTRRHGFKRERSSRYPPRVQKSGDQTARARQHQSHRRFALAMTRQRDRTAIDGIDQRAIAQRQHVGCRIGYVTSEIGDDRRGDRHRRRDQRVVGCDAALEAYDDRAADTE